MKETTLASIPKLADQWKIIHDFKPTEYSDTAVASVWMSASGSGRLDILSIYFDQSGVQLAGRSVGIPKSNQLPKLGEWTRIEISHEMEDGKYFVAFSVGGKEVGRTVVDESSRFRNLKDVKIYTGDDRFQKWTIRGLVILERQE